MEKEQGLLQSVKVNITGVIIILRELSLKKREKKKWSCGWKTWTKN